MYFKDLLCRDIPADLVPSEPAATRPWSLESPPSCSRYPAMRAPDTPLVCVCTTHLYHINRVRHIQDTPFVYVRPTYVCAQHTPSSTRYDICGRVHHTCLHTIYVTPDWFVCSTPLHLRALVMHSSYTPRAYVIHTAGKVIHTSYTHWASLFTASKHHGHTPHDTTPRAYVSFLCMYVYMRAHTCVSKCVREITAAHRAHVE